MAEQRRVVPQKLPDIHEACLKMNVENHSLLGLFLKLHSCYLRLYSFEVVVKMKRIC